MNKETVFHKVVTKDNKSLGLRKNPTILTYKENTWIKSPTVISGNRDDGGIWVASSLSGARRLVKYMLEKHKKSCKIIRVEINKILYKNNYRLKTDKIKWIAIN
jgi:hypothetical protein